MGKRKKTELLAAYVYPETLEKADGLVDELFEAKLIGQKNRSELVRFCLVFMFDFMSRKPNIEFLKTVKDYLALEGITDSDSLGAFASLSSEFLTFYLHKHITSCIPNFVTKIAIAFQPI